MKNILSILSFTIFFGCSASINTSFQSQKSPLTKADKVAFLDTHHKVPENAQKLGDGKFGDSGFSTDCSFDSNLIKARDIARENGANIVKVKDNSTPDLWSSCHRMKIEYYYYDGKIEDLRQYQLKIN